MREMVLNHASIQAPNQYTAVEWLKDVTAGMTLLTLHKVAEPTIRMNQDLHEVTCLNDWSLWDALLELQRVGAREEYLFFVRLSTKVPLLSEIAQDVMDRFLGCEAKSLPPKDGAPLLLCSITDGIAVGFPSEPVWDRDQLTVRFNELSDDDIILEVSETIDNLTRIAHARSICERHRVVLRQCKNFAELWGNRTIAFPHLVFGPDVDVNAADLQTVINKLASLDDTAAKWRDIGGAVPPWMSKVTPESGSVMNNEKLREARRFRSRDGTQKLFVWHARFGSQGRIHLRFDPRAYEVEIGYIGKKLPTALFS